MAPLHSGHTTWTKGSSNEENTMSGTSSIVNL
jgi:hypothetical protein